MFKEQLTVDCPFCKTGEIIITYYPPVKKFRKGPWGGSRAGVRKSTSDFIVNTNKCPNCSKSNDEIEKELKKEGFL